MRLARALALVLFMPALAAAQAPVTVTGRIEPATSPPACDAGATHRIRDTSVHLKSGVVDLALLPGITMTFSGPSLGPACPVIDVAVVTPAAFSLSVCNATGAGCPVTIDMCPSPSDGVYAIGAAAASGFLPIAPGLGSLLLDPASLVVVASGANLAVCQSIPAKIPASPSAVGVELFLQGLAASPTVGSVLSNVHRVTVLAPTTKCTSFACF